MIVYVIKDNKWHFRINNVIILVMIVSLTNSKYIFHHLLWKLLKSNPVLVIPANMVNDKDTYDVYPWLTSYAYFNKLNYHPRPVIQSYTSYTPKLDSINSVFFSDKKVDHIIFHGGKSNLNYMNAIDNRYFMFEEPLTKMKIMENYGVTNRINDSTFIVSKREESIGTDLKIFKELDMTLDKEVNISDGFDPESLYFFTMDLKYLTSAKLLGFAMRMPYIKVEMTLKSGDKQSFNAVPDLLKHPCILNKYCADYSDFFALVNSTKSDSLTDIKSIKFYSSSRLGSSGFEPNFKMKIYRSDRVVEKIVSMR